MREHNRRLIEQFRAAGGRLEGRALLLLTTIGARSGLPRTTPMMFVPDGDRLLVIASNAGAPRHPDWYRNLVANPTVTVEVDGETYPATATPLRGREYEETFAGSRSGTRSSPSTRRGSAGGSRRKLGRLGSGDSRPAVIANAASAIRFDGCKFEKSAGSSDFVFQNVTGYCVHATTTPRVSAKADTAPAVSAFGRLSEINRSRRFSGTAGGHEGGTNSGFAPPTRSLPSGQAPFDPRRTAMTTPTDQAQPTFVDSERGLLIAVLVMVLLGVTAVLVVMG